MPWNWRRLLDCAPSIRKGTPVRNNEGSSTRSDLGLKLLYAGADSQIDIVAVHGEGGHREQSWTAVNGVNWLRDLLPDDLPSATIYTWGYDSTDGTSLKAISESLVSDLWEARKEDARCRPIIFIAHSQGGTIVKGALVYCNSSKNGSKRTYYAIKQATYGVIFASTLELDSRINGLETYVANSIASSSTMLNDSTFNEAHFLLTVLRQYTQISGGFKTVYARESTQTRAPGRPPVDSRPPAAPAREENVDSNTILINASHGDMVKFQLSSDEGYLKFREHLMTMAKDAKDQLHACSDNNEGPV